MLPLAGFAAEPGQLAFGVAVATATAGSVAGAGVLYAAGWFGGRPVLNRYHPLLRLDNARLDRAEAWFDRHGSAVVLWARMVPLARSAISVPAGMAVMGLVVLGPGWVRRRGHRQPHDPLRLNARSTTHQARWRA